MNKKTKLKDKLMKSQDENASLIIKKLLYDVFQEAISKTQ